MLLITLTWLKMAFELVVDGLTPISSATDFDASVSFIHKVSACILSTIMFMQLLQ